MDEVQDGRMALLQNLIRFICKALTYLYLIFTLAITAHTEDNGVSTPELRTRCGGYYGLCGYVNADDWKSSKIENFVIEPTYQKTTPFSEGLAAVRIKGKWGYINLDNDVVIKPQFDLAGPFTHGLAEVLISDKIGIIGRNGKIKIKPQFARAIPLTSKVSIVKEGIWKPHPSSRRNTLTSFDSSSLLPINGKLYHLDKGFISTENHAFKVFNKSDTSLIWARLGGRDSVWGLMEPDGKWHVKSQFKTVYQISHGLAVVSKTDAEETGQRPYEIWGALDIQGNVAVPIIHGRINGWRENWGDFSSVWMGKKKGILTKNGKLVGDRYFDDYKLPSREGENHSVLENGVWLSVQTDGTFIPDKGYTAFTCENGLKMVRRGKTVEFFAPDGSRIGNMSFNDSYISESHCGKPMFVMLGKKQGFILYDGTLFGGGLIIESAYTLKNGVVAVKVADKWGIINASGQYILKPIYDDLQPHGNDTLRVKTNDVVTFISHTGETVPNPKLKEYNRPKLLECGGKAKLFHENGKWGLKSKDDKVLIKAAYPVMSCFRSGVAWVPNEKESAWCPINPKGKREKALECKKAYYPYNQTHSFPERLDPDPYKNSVLWTTGYYEYGAGLRDEPSRMIPDRLYRKPDAEIAKMPTKHLKFGTHSISPN